MWYIPLGTVELRECILDDIFSAGGRDVAHVDVKYIGPCPWGLPHRSPSPNSVTNFESNTIYKMGNDQQYESLLAF